MMSSRLLHRRVFVVFDNLDHIDKLKPLAGENKWFGSGSRIIITNRNEHLLKVFEVDGWFSKVSQFFEYQGTTEPQKVALASFHLEGEANQWWQWLRPAYQEEGSLVTWETFAKELWARFGPTECEDFDEALSRKEFERLGNGVYGWTQKALVGTFMGGLKPEIFEDIRMLKPRTLKEAISLARMKNDQLSRQKKFLLPPMESPTTGPVKRLT
ncbi:hypothetical protein KPL71_023582 [Citrus sinensis]|uniref:Uncharacterized protein n=1 Tax=Citrus sinensis TaxID=2711 RepID=A0ACB8IK84_CITSI|nr:hypothetical protein KPL71_023582 [Citrus sinensis]